MTCSVHGSSYLASPVMLLWLTPAAMRGSRLSLFRSLALLVPLLVLFSAASAAAKAGLAVTTQQQVRVGEAIKFQWHGGTPPYTLKVIVNNKVVSQNEGWTGNSVQWRSTPGQIPIGSEIKIRLSDSEGQMVLSDVTKVVGDSNDSQNYDDDDEKRPIWHQGMDDPHSGGTKDRKTFGLEFGIGPGGMTLGVNRGPATATAAAEASPIGTEEPQPTGVPDWEASEVAGDTLLPQTGASSISDLATLTSDGASSANATSTATTAAVTADATNSVAIDSTVAGMSATDDASAAASSSTSTSETETKEESANADLYIGIAVIVLLAVVGLGGFFYWRVSSSLSYSGPSGALTGCKP
ncbi:hypothetical protein JCM3774_003133 [Rhodotorula dairenensis]